MGAGRSEFANALYGITTPHKGEIAINGKTTRISSPADALRHGMALITEDRAQTGLVLTSPVSHNISIAALGRFSAAGFIRRALESGAVKDMIRRLAIRTPSQHTPVRDLSGGNQQKVVFARCLETRPQILLCDEPTRGIDEGAKREIYALLEGFASEGKGVLLISSEIPELLANADRIVVFRRGRVSGELEARTATQEMLVHLAS